MVFCYDCHCLLYAVICKINEYIALFVLNKKELILITEYRENYGLVSRVYCNIYTEENYPESYPFQPSVKKFQNTGSGEKLNWKILKIKNEMNIF